MLINKFVTKLLLIASVVLTLGLPKVVAQPPDLSELLAIIDALPEGSWTKVNVNQFSDVWTPAELRPLYGLSNPTPQSIIGAWSSFAWDSNQGDLIIYGGGHANYNGNDVYRWRSSTRMWERASLPSEVTQDGLGNWIVIDGVDAAPISAHTYDNQLFLPIADRFLTFGGAAFNNGDAYFRQIDALTAIRTGPYLFNPNKANGDQVGGTTGSHVQRVQPFPEIIGGEMWENRDIYQNISGNPPLPFSFVNSTTDYTQENGKDVVYVTARPGGGTATNLYKYTVNDVNNPGLDEWELVGIYWGGISGQGAGLYDPVLNIYFRSGSSSLTYWSLANAGSNNRNQSVSLTDLSGQFAINPDFGMDYDANRHQYLLWEGYSEVWAIQPPSAVSSTGWQVTKLPNSQTPGPSLGPGVGILGKWKYIAQLDVFMGLQGVVSGNIWLYKPIGWEHPQLGTRALKPTISPISGNFIEPVTVMLGTQQQQGTIHYTTDGSEPTAQSTIYTGSFITAQSMTVKAMTVAPGLRNSRTTVVSYSFDLPNQAPQVSLTSLVNPMVNRGEPINLQLLLNDPDNGPQPLTAQWQIITGQGNVVSQSADQATYTPDLQDTLNVHQLQIEVSDGNTSTTLAIEILVTDQQPALLFNNFTEISQADWLAVSNGNITAPGDWQLTNGQLAQLSNIYSLPTEASVPDKLGTYFLYQNALDWTNYRVETVFSSADDDEVGVMFRYQDDNNYYRFSWNKSHNRRRLIKRVDGQFFVLAEEASAYQINQKYQLAIEVSGNQIKVLIDNAVVFDVSDNSFNNGTVALYSWANQGAFFDYIAVTPLSSSTNQPPVINQVIANPNTITDEDVTTIDVLATDADGPQTLSYQWSVVSGNGQIVSLTPTQINYIPSNVNSTEFHIVEVTVSDGINNVSQQVGVTVNDSQNSVVLLNETFTAFDFANWNIVTEGGIQAPARWENQQNKLTQLSNVYSTPTASNEPTKLGTYIQYLAGQAWSDYQLSVKLKSTDDDQLGVMFRLVDNQHYYRFSWNKSGNRRQLTKRDGTSFIVLAEDMVPYQQGTTYLLKIVAKDSLLSVFIDNQLVFEVVDTSYRQGSIALYSWANSGSEFSELLVTDLSDGTMPPQIVAEQPLPVVINENSNVQLSVTVDNVSAPTTQYLWQLTGPGQLTATMTAMTNYQVANVAKTMPVKVTATLTNNSLINQQTYYGTVINPLLPNQVMNESFDQFNSAFWQVVTEGNILAPANWHVLQGVLVEDSNVYSQPTEAADLAKKGSYLVYKPGIQWQNYLFNCLIQSDDNDAIGVAFRYQDNKHYYRFSWDKQNQYRRLIKRVGDSYTLLAEDQVVYQEGKSYQLQIVANNASLQVVIDGEVIFNVVDSDISQGSIAPYSWGSRGSRFDDMIVDLLP